MLERHCDFVIVSSRVPNPEKQKQEPKRRWPWFLLAGVILFFLVSILWVLSFVERVKRIRDSTREMNRTSSVANPFPPERSWTNEMVWIAGGTFLMGSEDGPPDELPVHQVTVDGFWMDATEVSNEQFEKFVRATHYVTIAEKKPEAKDYPTVPPDKLVAGSIVFTPRPDIDSLENHFAWWSYVPGADWRHPEGPASSIAGREKHPVVHVAWIDAMAYCKWAGKRLPTEAEWECAARAGKDRLPFVWGQEKTPGGKWQANIWQGRFPNENTTADGFRSTAPVGSFPPNGFGLFDMAGNVWEWCQDWYMPDYYAHTPRKNPGGPDESYDPNEPGVWKRVQRGGSFLCSDSYCTGYRPSARMKASPDTGLSHTGFRCVRSN